MSPREKARAKGLKRYIDPSNPCLKCGGIERETAKNKCVACKKANAARYRAAKRAEQPEKVEGDFREPLTEFEQRIASAVFYRVLQLSVTARFGRRMVEIEERVARQRRSKVNAGTER